ncbi:MAG: CPBP family intramembrane glutamic endopeptidase [Tuberibacillus sp.]
MKKREPVNLDQLSDRDIIKNFYYSQGLLFFIACVCFVIFRNNLPGLSTLFSFSFFDFFVLGVGSGVMIALIEWVIDHLVPESWFDDGGINKRIFKAFTYAQVIVAMLVVALVEEFLFRGIIQSAFGWAVASLLFGFIHVRYIKKPLMLIVALGLGFYLGWLYMAAESLIPPITAHFFIDVILGFVLKHTSGGKR